MCRHLAYLGPHRSLAELVLDPPYGLLRQSYAPREQAHGRLNADGFGVGWYTPEVRREPARYRRATPLWSDRTFASLAGVVDSSAILAAVRSATAPFPVEESSTAPFGAGPWLFSHNGRVEGYADAAPALRALLPAAAAAAVEGPSDAALLWALTRQHLEDGAVPAEAVEQVVAQLAARTTGRLNLLLTDGDTVAATAYGDTLCYRHEEGAVTVASEPSDDGPGWVRVPDRSLVVATRDDVTVAALPSAAAVRGGPA